MALRCQHPNCADPTIRYPETAWHRVAGWDRDRQGGGTNAVALRERTGVVICNGCMEELKLEWAGKIPAGKRGQLFA